MKFLCDNVFYHDKNDKRDSFVNTNAICNSDTLQAFDANVYIKFAACINCNSYCINLWVLCDYT